jgi:hypothetical protein
MQDFGNRTSSKDGKDIYCKSCKLDFTQQWKKENPEKLKSCKRKSDLKWYFKNRQKKAEINRKWKQENKEKFDAWLCSYRSNLDSSKLEIAKSIKKIKASIDYAITRNKNCDRTISEVGYSVFELKEHLEGAFKKGMGWSNYGVWKISFVVPLNGFNLSNPQEIKRAFHYTNLKPAWDRRKLVRLTQESLKVFEEKSSHRKGGT